MLFLTDSYLLITDSLFLSRAIMDFFAINYLNYFF
jgi:hypothetical protein